MNNLKTIIRILVSLVSDPSGTWDALSKADSDDAKPAAMFHSFYYPLLGIVVMVLFLCEGFRGAAESETFSVQVGMTHMVPILVAYFVGPYLSLFAIKLALEKYFLVPNPDKVRLELFVFYCTGYLLSLEILFALIPSIQFFKFFSIYLFYITWCASSTYERVETGHRWKFTLFSFFVLWFSPWILSKAIGYVQS